MSILLKNGVVVVHDAQDNAKGIRADLLIESDVIARLEPNLSLPNNCQVIDCTNKIIAPGFIDTHRHLYNTALRGRHGNDVLPDYVVKGILQGGTFGERDLFWGQLAGCLECLHVGTTTVVDHSHLNYAENSPEIAIRATVASGIRSIYGFCFTGRVDSWSPFTMNQDYIAPFALGSLKKLATAAPFAEGRVQLGVAFDGWFLSSDVIKNLFKNIKALGIKHITTHNAPSPPGVPTSIEIMKDCGVFSPKSAIILGHANHLSPSDAAVIKQEGAYISSTPSVELQMGIGRPACFDPDLDVQAQSSLGIDCHNVVLGSIVSEMRSALVYSRGSNNEKFQQNGKIPAVTNHSVQEVYALGTIQGARAVGMQDQIGSLCVGKKADIVVFDALAPSMVCAAQRDPVTAIVMHSTPGDISMTFVDGILRKSGGELLPVQLNSTDATLADVMGPSVSWAEVTENLLKSQAALQAKLETFNLETTKPTACAMFGMDPSIIVAKL